jgi:hypothetical protein
VEPVALSKPTIVPLGRAFSGSLISSFVVAFEIGATPEFLALPELPSVLPGDANSYWFESVSDCWSFLLTFEFR